MGLLLYSSRLFLDFSAVSARPYTRHVMDSGSDRRLAHLASAQGQASLWLLIDVGASAQNETVHQGSEAW